MSQYSTLADAVIGIAGLSFPGRSSLSPSELAIVLLIVLDAESLSTLRTKTAGTVPDAHGLRKRAGRWLIPLSHVKHVIEAADKRQTLAALPATTVGPRGGAGDVWKKVWEKYAELKDLRDRLSLTVQLSNTLAPPSSLKKIKEERF